MTPADDLPSAYRFADLTLDVARRCVTRHGEPIELKALDFDLLRFLVEQAPNVVNADVLAEKVWGRHFVSPENVAQRVMLLRQSLSDDASRPRYIETVRNKGYRLIPVVERASAEQTQTALQHRRRLVGAAIAAAVVAVGVMATSGYWPGATGEPSASSPRSIAIVPSVAVLPFESRSRDPDDAHFAIAMRDEVVNQLTKIKGLRVIPLQLTDDMQALVANTARDRNIVATLRAGVYSSDGRVRVTPLLTETSTGASLWSESYERELSNVFAIHSDIALDVANALRLELSDSERQRIAHIPTVDPRARDLYLKARVLRLRETRDDLQSAISAIEEAIRIDEAFTEAWIVNSSLQGTAQFYFPERAAEHRARAEQAARRAVALDPESGGAYAALGLALIMNKDWKGGETANRKAVDLNGAPELSTNCMLYLAAGNFASARDLMEKDHDLQPQNPTIHRFLMFTYAALGDWAAATRLYESGIELFVPWRQGPNHWMHWLVGGGELVKARDIPVDDAFNQSMLASLDAPQEALMKLRREHETTGTSNPILSRDIALWAGQFGDAELAFRAMRTAIDEQGGQMMYIWLPQLAEMRRLPEFKAYLREIGMVDYWKEYGWPDICRQRGDDDFACD